MHRRMPMVRTGTLLTALTAFVLGPGGATMPAAGAAEGARCTGELVATLTPGIGSEPASGVFHSEGEGGTLTCGGRSGTIGEDGRYGTERPVTCSSGGQGWGVHTIVVDGTTIRNTFTFEFGGISGGLVSGKFAGERYSGTFTFTPSDGDCVSSPVTKGHVKLDGILR